MNMQRQMQGPMFEWDQEDNFSFEDSDRFEEDSICSWISEPESVVNNWRGWRKNNASLSGGGTRSIHDGGGVNSLLCLASKEVAASIPFELVENVDTFIPHIPGLPPPKIPPELQIQIAFWSFPENEEDIRLYSCLANGSDQEFLKGDNLLKMKAVKNPLQIGFHLMGTVTPGGGKPSQSTSVTFDRKKITKCSCSCNPQAEWCAHVVALCLHRIHQPNSVERRAPMSSSLDKIKDKLDHQKLAQYVIWDELKNGNTRILATYQRVLDDLLSKLPNDINQSNGGPDDTLGGVIDDPASWYLDSKNLKENIKKILTKFCVPAPIVYSDVNYLSNTAPPSASEWCSFLRPLRGREPEGMWNLLSIIRELFRRNDRNSIPLLEIITQQCLEANQIMVWWFNTKVVQNSARGPSTKQVNSNAQASQNACSSLCDEIVILWKLAALNPCIPPKERNMLRERLVGYHTTAIGQILANQQNCSNSSGGTASSGSGSSKNGKKPSDLDTFPGFKSAIEACMLDWKEYPIPGVTYGHNSHYLCPFAVFKLNDSEPTVVSHVNSSAAVLRCEYPGRPRSTVQQLQVQLDHKSAEDARQLQQQQPNSLSSENGANSDEGMGDEEPVQDSVLQDESSNNETNDDGNGSENAAAGGGGGGGDGAVVPAAVVRDYEVYYYDPKNASRNSSNDSTNPGDGNGKNGEKLDVFKDLRTSIDDPFEVKFMRAEGIYAHGYHSHACQIAVALAKDLLESPLKYNLFSGAGGNGSGGANHPESGTIAQSGSATGTTNRKKKPRVNAASHKVTQDASKTLSHCAFLCTVLSEVPEYRSLAFKVGMFGIEMARPPASTKPMEVKLAHQESELVSLLKKIPLGPEELSNLREKAERLRDGTLSTIRGEALLPIMLASYIFESLVTSNNSLLANSDKQLGFDACVTAIGLKANVSEADHPLLCEGTRRQRGDLALMLLVHYKDQPDNLFRIMEKLLDKEIHQLSKTPLQPSDYASQPQRSVSAAMRNLNLNNNNNHHHQGGGNGSGGPHQQQQQLPQQQPLAPQQALQQNQPIFDWDAYLSPPRGPTHPGPNHHHTPAARMANRSSVTGPGSDSGSSGNSSADSMDSSASSNRNRKYPHEDSPELGGSAPGSSAQTPAASVSLASVASAAGGGGAGASSVAAMNSSASVAPLGAAALPSPSLRQIPSLTHHEMSTMIRTSLPGLSTGLKIRYKGRKAYPSVPNQPSEALAHFMFELAKQVLNKAGGTSSTSLFTQPSANQNHRGPHRNLHMCAFQIGLYALGLHNRVSPNWLSRTYSSHVSWISYQALEIGEKAIRFLIGAWEGHLTPSEAAKEVADKASKTRDNSMIRAAAELALSVLSHASALSQHEIQRGIQQCKEESDWMLTRACDAVEKAARSGGVFPEVMFEVAKHWYELHNKHLPAGNSMATPPPVTPPQQQQQQQPMTTYSPEAFMAMAAASGIAYFPSLFPGFQPQLQPGHPANAGAPLHMYVSPQQVVAAVSNAASMQPVTTSVSACPPPQNNVAAAFNNYAILAANRQQLQPAGLHMAPLLQGPYPPIQHPAALAASIQLQQAAAVQAAQVHALHHNLQHPPPQARQEVPPAVVTQTHSTGEQNYLGLAFRVGMLALASLGKRVSEDRPQAKFSKTPHYSDDVKWLMTVAKELGTNHLFQLLDALCVTKLSPFLIKELTIESGIIFWQYTHGLAATQTPPPKSDLIRTINLVPVLRRLAFACCECFCECIMQKLFHLTSADYDEYILTLKTAREVFYWILPEGIQKYSHLLTNIKRSKSCKRDLWNKIEQSEKQENARANSQTEMKNSFKF